MYILYLFGEIKLPRKLIFTTVRAESSGNFLIMMIGDLIMPSLTTAQQDFDLPGSITLIMISGVSRPCFRAGTQLFGISM